MGSANSTGPHKRRSNETYSGGGWWGGVSHSLEYQGDRECLETGWGKKSIFLRLSWSSGTWTGGSGEKKKDLQKWWVYTGRCVVGEGVTQSLSVGDKGWHREGVMRSVGSCCFDCRVSFLHFKMMGKGQ